MLWTNSANQNNKVAVKKKRIDRKSRLHCSEPKYGNIVVRTVYIMKVISNINKLLLSNKIGLYYSVACFSNKCHADLNNFKIGL